MKTFVEKVFAIGLTWVSAGFCTSFVNAFELYKSYRDDTIVLSFSVGQGQSFQHAMILFCKLSHQIVTSVLSVLSVISVFCLFLRGRFQEDRHISCRPPVRC